VPLSFIARWTFAAVVAAANSWLERDLRDESQMANLSGQLAVWPGESAWRVETIRLLSD
jgi:hypothetical protein